MQKQRGIPEEYMTVGQLAKKMGTTVRTLQYYDKEGLLAPAAESEGGRRLYTHRDMIKLHQIRSLKSLGFSLDDIKNKLVSLDTPDEVVEVLTQQAQAVREKIKQLTETLSAIEALKEEVAQMQTVDFKKYADIIVNLQMNNEFYWLIKHFDDETLDHIRGRFDQQSGRAFMERFNQLNDRVSALQQKQAPPEDERVQALAKEFWDMIVEFTNGDMSMLPKLMAFADRLDDNRQWIVKQKNVNEYLQPALALYFQKAGIDPFQEAQR